MLRREHAFTLIELLIVVAIIGILAAIAVPNFLNAQTRAKIARVKGDMKAIESALEMYRIDHNTYMRCYGGNPPEQYRPLTTPIAYIATPPLDPFRNGLAGVNVRREFYGDQHAFPTEEIDYGTFDAQGVFRMTGRLRYWMLVSLGPDRDEDFGITVVGPTKNNAYTYELYMASNGLNSDGDLLHASWLTIHF